MSMQTGAAARKLVTDFGTMTPLQRATLRARLREMARAGAGMGPAETAVRVLALEPVRR